MRYLTWMLTLCAVILTGCDASDAERGNKEDVSLSVAFHAADFSAGKTEGQPIVGSNGTLEIERIAFVVSEMELRADGDRCLIGALDDDCQEVEMNPRLVTLEMDGSATVLTTTRVPAGSYTAIEFEIEDVDFDDEEAAEVATSIRERFADWPEGASMLVIGTFTAEDGTVSAFRTYLDADVEVEREFVEPAEVRHDQTLRIRVDPSTWFRGENDTVINLSELAHDIRGELAELEAEIEEGFASIDWGH